MLQKPVLGASLVPFWPLWGFLGCPFGFLRAPFGPPGAVLGCILGYKPYSVSQLFKQITPECLPEWPQATPEGEKLRILMLSAAPFRPFLQDLKKDLPIPNCPVADSGVSPMDTIIQ